MKKSLMSLQLVFDKFQFCHKFQPKHSKHEREDYDFDSDSESELLLLCS